MATKRNKRNAVKSIDTTKELIEKEIADIHREVDLRALGQEVPEEEVEIEEEFEEEQLLEVEEVVEVEEVKVEVKEVKIAPVAAPAAAPIVKEDMTPKVHAQEAALNVYLEGINGKVALLYKELSGSDRALLTNVITFTREFGINVPVTESKMASGHANLFRILVLMITHENTAMFNKLFGATLLLISDNLASCFSDIRRFRFLPNSVMTESRSDSYRNLINMLCVLANPATRNAAKSQVNIETSINIPELNEIARARLVDFFG